MITYVITKCNKKIDGINIYISADEFEIHDIKAEIRIEFCYNKAQLTKVMYIELFNKYTYESIEVQDLISLYIKINKKIAVDNAFISNIKNNSTNNIINMIYECFCEHKDISIFSHNHHFPMGLILQALKAYINSSVYKGINNIINKQEVAIYGL